MSNFLKSKTKKEEKPKVHLAVFGKCSGCHYCVNLCPEPAISEDTPPVIDYSRCNLCMKCIEACPFDAVFLTSDGSKLIKCDLCEGDPACVKACAPEALEWIKKYKFGERKKLVLNLNPYRGKK